MQLFCNYIHLVYDLYINTNKKCGRRVRPTRYAPAGL